MKFELLKDNCVDKVSLNTIISFKDSTPLEPNPIQVDLSKPLTASFCLRVKTKLDYVSYSKIKFVICPATAPSPVVITKPIPIVVDSAVTTILEANWKRHF